MYHHGQRVSVTNRQGEKEDKWWIAVSQEDTTKYRKNKIPAVIVTDNRYHLHQMRNMTPEEIVADYDKSFSGKYHLYYFHAWRINPIDPCKNENVSNRLERIDD